MSARPESTGDEVRYVPVRGSAVYEALRMLAPLARRAWMLADPAAKARGRVDRGSKPLAEEEAPTER
jgi:hypothetical protein